jgi:restriction system protein
MARRSSAFEDLMALSARLPWRVALGLALVSYCGLHWVAGYYSAPVAARTPAEIGAVAQRQLVATLAFFLQWIIPIGFGAGGLISFVRRARDAGLFNRAVAGGPAAVTGLTWSEFEHMIGEGFRRQGYTVTGNDGRGPDGGVDLALVKGTDRFLVQCKHWRRSSVGVTVIREFYGVMTARAVAGGFVVTSGSFTPDAWGFAAQCGIELIDGVRLQGWISRAKAPEQGSRGRVLEAPVAPQVTSATPACPRCGGAMVTRTAGRGFSAGQSFWGCTRYPRCRGTLSA